MTQRVFGDASFYIALISPFDKHHAVARSLAAEPSLRISTTEFVLCEVANFFAASGRVRFLEVMTAALQVKGTRVSAASRRLFHAGWELYASRSDKEWSLTDCTSFVEMKRLGIREALTNDHHFAQAGFRVLMK